LVMMHMFLQTNQQMQILGRRPKTRRISDILQLSWSQLNNKTNGRLDIFLSHRSCHPLMFLLLVMDEYIISFYV
jgi:hypothetical protein